MHTHNSAWILCTMCWRCKQTWQEVHFPTLTGPQWLLDTFEKATQIWDSFKYFCQTFMLHLGQDECAEELIEVSVCFCATVCCKWGGQVLRITKPVKADSRVCYTKIRKSALPRIQLEMTNRMPADLRFKTQKVWRTSPHKIAALCINSCESCGFVW